MRGLTGAVQSEGLTVVGEGRVSAVPDFVVLIIGLESSSGSALQALNETATRMVHVVQAMVNKGITQADMQASWVNVYPVYPQGGQVLAGSPGNNSANQQTTYGAFPQASPSTTQGSMPQVAAFLASRGLQISLNNPNRMGEILDTAIAAGANFSSGFSLRLRDETAVRRTALEIAAKNARAKAEVLAATTGRELGAVVGIVEELFPGSEVLGSASGGPTGGFLGGYQNISTQPTLPGELTFMTRVRAKYELR